MLVLIIVGSRISLLVGITATIVAVAARRIDRRCISGYFGGTKIDTGLNAVTNWFLVIPWLVLAIVLSAILGASVWIIILVIGVTSWAQPARLIRAQALSVRARPYVERARVLGASDWAILTRHVLPNVSPVIFANAILTVAIAILTETTLSILGLGDPTAISWGVIIEQAFSRRSDDQRLLVVDDAAGTHGRLRHTGVHDVRLRPGRGAQPQAARSDR